ncbi:RHS repeat-associated core domain-containing protein [Kitasatospora sp. NPDC006697]|uniref:RHS repeat-associated core domain-containing protein n=1 Tax=Kitasatospora sp. NPDC006697 TaxID=3364020 RepID=UPI0036B0C014
MPFKRAPDGKGTAAAPVPAFDPTVAAKLPAAGSAVVDLSSTSVTRQAARADGLAQQQAAPVRAGALPVLIGRPADAEGSPSRVQVTLADQTIAQAAGVHGVLFSLAPEDTAAGSGTTTVTVDSSSFRSAFGGDYASRLHLVQLPGCALTTPQLHECQTQTPVTAVPGQALTTQVKLAAKPAGTVQAMAMAAPATATNSTATVLAATSTPNGSDGSYSATPLSPAGTWTAGGSTGSFHYSYPIKLPPAIAGSSPDVSLSYDSSTQDGRTAGTNNQSSWLGDGWSSAESYIERSYKSCADDSTSGAPQYSGDRCWAGQSLTLSLNGQSTQLVYDDKTHTFHAQQDAATEKVEQLFLSGGASNGTYNGEYFRVTQNGTQYYFGLNQLPGYSSGKQATQSVYTEPVYGAHAGDPCNASTFASSSCTQGWRWNLDYVVDLHNNATAYYYQPETNYYGADAQTTGVPYIRGGYLTRIDYGMTASTVYSGTAPEQVQFAVAERCLPGTPAGNNCTDDQFTTSNGAYWPDVPIDQNCAPGVACQAYTPTFWSRKRLTSITTLVQINGATQQVDRYDFTQSFPDGGDHAPTLWLDAITRTGLDTAGGTSGTASTPVTSFDPPNQLPNRVGTVPNLPVMYHDRISSITTETGAKISVTYDQTQCTPSNVPSDPSTNTLPCFPVLWKPPGYTTNQADWFYTYTVHSVRTQDLNETNQDGTYPELLTTYKYLGGAGWHYDDNELVKPENRTYGQFRGYGRVETRTGDTTVAHTTNGTRVSDQLTLTATTYLRGLSNNTADGTGGSAVTVTSQDGKYSAGDSNALAGEVFETDAYTRDGGSIDHATVTIPTIIGPTASRARTGLAPLTAQMVRTATTYNSQAVSYGTRSTESDTFYNTTLGQPTTGMAVQADDRGEVAAAGNTPKCTFTRYVENPVETLVLTAETMVNAQDCTSANAGQTGALISDKRTSYDGNAFTWDGASPAGSAPAKGEPTLTEIGSAANGAVATAYLAELKTGYDSYGRPVTVTRTPNSTAPDGSSLAQTTTTTYTPANGAVPTGTTAKVQVTAGSSPTYQSSTVTLDPARNLPIEKVDAAGLKTDLVYDQLGRLTGVWLPAQSKTAGASASLTYSYAVSNTAPTAVTAKSLLDNGSYKSTVTLYDALLRTRQVQAQAENGTSTVSDTQYDSHGWTVLSNSNYNVAALPGSTLVMVAQNSVPDTLVTDHDGEGRATATNEEHNGTTPAGMTTATVYTGDSQTVFPKAGGVVTRTVTDARGQQSELDQYTTAPTLTGTAQTGYTATGGIISATRYRYNAAGKQTAMTAPDNTSWSFSYDLLGRRTQQTDPDAGTSTYGFDDAGNQVSDFDSRKIELDYSYDLLGRKTTETDKSTGAKLASWLYDTLQAGKPTSTTRYTSGGSYTVATTGYTSLGKPTGTTITLPSTEAPLPTTYTTTFAYSTNDQLLIGQTDQRVPGALAGEALSYNRDALGNATSATSGLWTYAQNVVYTNYNEPSQITFGPSTNPAWATYSYDDQTRRPSELLLSRTQAPGPTVDDITYGYNSAGDPTSVVDKQADTNTTDTQCFQYDALDHLAQAWTAAGTCPATGTGPSSATVAGGSAAYWESYSYDPVGNRTGMTSHAVNGATGDTVTTYTNGCTGTCPNGPQPHTLATASVTGPAGTSSTAFGYSPTGATTTRTPSNGQAQNLHWDDEGRVDVITQGTNSTTKYLYDADGNLLIRRDPGQTTLFAGDTQIVVNTAVTPNVLLGGVRTYTLGGNTTVATRSTLPNGGTEYVLNDAHDTAVLGLDITTQKATRKQYTPYGQARGTATGWTDPTRGFLGKPQDTSTGYTDVGARLYDPGLGRFISDDPVLETNNPQELGGYGYAAGNPVAGSDPTGLSVNPDMVDGGGTACTYVLKDPCGTHGDDEDDDGGGGGGGTAGDAADVFWGAVVGAAKFGETVENVVDPICWFIDDCKGGAKAVQDFSQKHGAHPGTFQFDSGETAGIGLSGAGLGPVGEEADGAVSELGAILEESAGARNPDLVWATESYDGWQHLLDRHRIGAKLYDAEKKGAFIGKEKKVKQWIQQVVKDNPALPNTDGRDGFIYRGRVSGVGINGVGILSGQQARGLASDTAYGIEVIVNPDGSLRTAYPIP